MLIKHRPLPHLPQQIEQIHTLSWAKRRSLKTWGQRSASFRSEPLCMKSQLEHSHFLVLSTCIENRQVRAGRGIGCSAGRMLCAEEKVATSEDKQMFELQFKETENHNIQLQWGLNFRSKWCFSVKADKRRSGLFQNSTKPGQSPRVRHPLCLSRLIQQRHYMFNATARQNTTKAEWTDWNTELSK